MEGTQGKETEKAQRKGVRGTMGTWKRAAKVTFGGHCVANDDLSQHRLGRPEGH